jgi:hypothetical protein
MTVRELTRKLTVSELRDWMAYDNLNASKIKMDGSATTLF